MASGSLSNSSLWEILDVQQQSAISSNTLPDRYFQRGNAKIEVDPLNRLAPIKSISLIQLLFSTSLSTSHHHLTCFEPKSPALGPPYQTWDHCSNTNVNETRGKLINFSQQILFKPF